jgi:hypothetical protein
MINLVPKKAKKRVVVEYWSRVAIVWGATWSLGLLVCVVALLPTFVLINIQVTEQEFSANQAVERIDGFQQASQQLIQASQQAKLILDESSVPVFSDYLTLVEGLQGSSIELTNIGIGRAEDGISLGQSQLRGVAVDRRSLADFRNRLLVQESIETVELPISNLALDREIPFDITVTFSLE